MKKNIKKNNITNKNNTNNKYNFNVKKNKIRLNK